MCPLCRLKSQGEECDDGNLENGDGCNAQCKIEENYFCLFELGFADTCSATLALCGNGILDLGEACDDGNLNANDGCSAQCKIERLYECRDGCSGPLCETEQHCPEVLFGKKQQVSITVPPPQLACAFLHSFF